MSSTKKPDMDERFLRVQNDPRFWEIPDRENKINIDKRFQSMFHDSHFKMKDTVDKRGRPVSHTSTEDLKRFYKLSDSEDEVDAKQMVKSKNKKTSVKMEKYVTKGETSHKTKGEIIIKEAVAAEDSEEEEQIVDKNDADLEESLSDGSEEEDDEEEREEAGGAEQDNNLVNSLYEDESDVSSDEDTDSGPDLARGKGNVETSSEDSEDEVDAILRREEEQIEHNWGELCKDAPRSNEVSARLAVCNMDWDRMKAKDLLALCSSFLPKGGTILSVKIYPSKFGMERMKMEENQGPMELRALPEDSEDDTEEEKIHRERMREYQFKRLKYYYGVIECDSADTAAKLYEECDGFEYESSCSVLDLRFISENTTFDDEPKDMATEINLSAYTPKLFTSSATSTSKVQLTWDETDHERVTALSKKFNKDELLDMDFSAYLASSSEDEDSVVEFGEVERDTAAAKQSKAIQPAQGTSKKEKKKKEKSIDEISKYRELLKGIKSKENKLQENKDMEMEITWMPGLKDTTEQLMKKKLEGKDGLTPWEEFLEKKKLKKKQKKHKQPQSNGSNEPDDLPADVDLSDPFFAEELGATSEMKRKTKAKQRKKGQVQTELTIKEEEEIEKRKAEMALLMDNTDDGKRRHFNYDKIVEHQNLSKKKRKKLKKRGEVLLEDDDFQVDVKDPRFKAVFTSHLFNLDPSHPCYRKTKATQSIVAEKQRIRQKEQRHVEDAVSAVRRLEVPMEILKNDSGRTSAEVSNKKVMDPKLSLLIKSVKTKTEVFQARKKQKLT